MSIYTIPLPISGKLGQKCSAEGCEESIHLWSQPFCEFHLSTKGTWKEKCSMSDCQSLVSCHEDPLSENPLCEEHLSKITKGVELLAIVTGPSAAVDSYTGDLFVQIPLRAARILRSLVYHKCSDLKSMVEHQRKIAPDKTTAYEKDLQDMTRLYETLVPLLDEEKKKKIHQARKYFEKWNIKT